jgi:oxygen-independent coproporphyrinogen-3 oxidase
VDDERYAAEFLEADRTLTQGGFEHYEVSNYGRPGHRARHNSAYWRRAPYLGFGPSAHSAWEDRREWNVREWAAYERALATGRPLEGGERLDPGAVQLECLYLGLRTSQGVPAALVAPVSAEQWIDAGWAFREGDRLCLTPEGWLRLDALVAAEARHGSPRTAPTPSTA